MIGVDVILVRSRTELLGTPPDSPTRSTDSALDPASTELRALLPDPTISARTWASPILMRVRGPRTTSSTRTHGEFLRLLFLQAHRETTAHLTVIAMSTQQHCDSFRYRRAAFYNGLESKVGLAAAKAAALRVNLNIAAAALWLLLPRHLRPCSTGTVDLLLVRCSLAETHPTLLTSEVAWRDRGESRSPFGRPFVARWSSLSTPG